MPVPWWAHLLGIAGVAVGLAAVQGLSSSRQDVVLYGAGLLIASLVLATGLVIGHNRRVAADPTDAREGVRTELSLSGPLWDTRVDQRMFGTPQGTWHRVEVPETITAGLAGACVDERGRVTEHPLLDCASRAALAADLVRAGRLQNEPTPSVLIRSRSVGPRSTKRSNG